MYLYKNVVSSICNIKIYIVKLPYKFKKEGNYE